MPPPLASLANGNTSATATPPRKPLPLGQARTPKVAAFRLNQVGGSPAQRVGSGNASFATVAGEAAQPSLVIQSQRFEEWMKIATDNVSLRGLARAVVGVGRVGAA